MNEVFGRPKLDPLHPDREITDNCWNGDHHQRDTGTNTCPGWLILSDKEREAGEDGKRCQCVCHDDAPPKPRKVKPISLPLPDVGTITIEKGRG